jgi:hypothetical protein
MFTPINLESLGEYCAMHFGAAVSSIEDVEMESSWMNPDTYSMDWSSCQFIVESAVAEKAVAWRKEVEKALEGTGLTVVKTEMCPIKDVNSPNPIIGADKKAEGLEMSLMVGHFNGLDDRGPLDDVFIVGAFLMSEYGPRKRTLYSKE